MGNDAGRVPIDPALLQHLACPRDREPVRLVGDHLECPAGHHFPVARGIPVMLLEPPEMVRDLVAQAERDWPQTEPLPAGTIDPFVEREIAATNGNMFLSALGRVRTYPIPRLRMPRGEGGWLVDIGCNWGRWLVAASRAGYRPIGIDPKITALFAAQRVCRQLGVEALLVAGDGRALPLRSRFAAAAYSYSVLQHMPRSEIELPLAEMGRVCVEGASVMIELPHRPGLWSLARRVRLRGPEPEGFGPAKAYSSREMREVFARCIGPATITVDGYFSINPGLEGLPLVRPHYKALLLVSEALRRLSLVLPPLTVVCDSAFISARRTVMSERPIRLPPSPAPNTIDLLRAGSAA